MCFFLIDIDLLWFFCYYNPNVIGFALLYCKLITNINLTNIGGCFEGL